VAGGDVPTILVADDDTAVLELIGGILNKRGYRVLLASGGRHALETFLTASSPIHLLLTDVAMPDLTGPVLASRLCARDAGLKVLFMSGYHDTEMVQRSVSNNGFSILPKPFTPDGLLRAVEQALD
jgi:DNA-binding NtrC family response regulator